MEAAVLEVDSLVTKFGSAVIHDGVSFRVERGKVVALIGGSGSGKSTMLREMIGLLQPTSGHVRLLGRDVWNSSPEELSDLRRRFGVLFQNSALFSALTVGENVALPLQEQMKFPSQLLPLMVQLRLGLTGLTPETAWKMPSELSGGMKKRVGLARALALEPDILFLDEPTSGLDPINARAFDKLIRTLSDSLKLTVFMVTHDLDSILGIADQVIALERGKVVADGPVEQVVRTKNDWIREYFSTRVE